ncbi:hypothetical protein J8I87_39570 [Paraburkholderia sp. LEh10]|uniref:hypothetical protein n=1 Tax=Paraburkholderia sp. LEh10 TaxID=2821353 RepID=UPI001AE92DEF|nr:hypothetical protein [Paraburkholderia sp. LEh10]MBP0595638.1 hypothetical protein [Paraburkholderia sp. LEh10]
MFEFLRSPKARKSWSLSLLFAAICGGISAYANFSDTVLTNVVGQPRWMLETHVIAAVIGTLLLARFVSGALSALFCLPGSAVYATGKLANGAAIRYRVDLKETFFSIVRFLQILGFVLCMMLQGVTVAPSASKQPNPPVQSIRTHLDALSA